MGIGFLPNKESMGIEVKKWTARRKLETLVGLCNSCIYKAFDILLAQECRTCEIRKGIHWILNDKVGLSITDNRLLRTG